MDLGRLRYLRLDAFRSALRLVQGHTRGRRMLVFLDKVPVGAQTRILDLGGRPEIWNSVSQRLDITILNLSGHTGREVDTHHDVRFVEGDACDPQLFGDRIFDVVFSNSVIEHVGDDQRQAAFAANVRRLGRRYWVQTPARWFPIEAHTGVPFWWFYPESVRQHMLQRWRAKLPDWTNDIAGTRVLGRERLRQLFPGGSLHVESLAGIPKSYAVYGGA